MKYSNNVKFNSNAVTYIKNNKFKILYVIIVCCYLLYKFWYVAIGLVVIWLITELIFYISHKKPLKVEEIRLLSEKRKKLYIKKSYPFIPKTVVVDLDFKSSMKPKGIFYKLDNDLAEFPSLIEQLLKGKKHEWIVLAIEKNKKVIGMWANKGSDGKSVSFNCKLKDMIEL